MDSDISIIIPSLNEEKNIGNILKDLSIQDTNIEVIVADAGSNDRTRDIAENYGAKIIDGGMPSVARNKGAMNASGKVLYFIDSDVRIRNNFIKNTYKEFKQKQLDIAGTRNKYLYSGEERFIDVLILETAELLTNIIFKTSEYFSKPKIIGTCMLLDKKSFLDSGGFKEDIYWGEDTELAQRMKKNGYKFGILNEDIYTSPRKPLSQGIMNYYINVIKLNNYRNNHGEITSRQIYEKITGIEDYFKK